MDSRYLYVQESPLYPRVILAKALAHTVNHPSAMLSNLPHINDTPDTIPSLHILKRSIDALQRLSMRDKFIDLQLPCHVIVHEIWKLGTSLDAAKGTSFPYAAGDELECWDRMESQYGML